MYLRALLTVLCMTSAAGSAGAQGTNVSFGALRADPSLPVEVTADQLDVNQETGSATFVGNVQIGQGEMRLAAARVLVIYSQDAQSIERMEATGGVTLVNGEAEAEAQRADYSIASGVIEMRGNVLLTQGPSILSSDRMVVDLSTGTAQMTGRVKTVLQTAD